MRPQKPDDVFYITFSKWKVWVYSIVCWMLACIPLLPILIFTEPLLTGERAFTSSVLFIFVICGPLFLLFAALGVIFLKKLGKPVATLTRDGFSGMKNFRNLNFSWTQNTVIYPSNGGSTILANLDASQSLASKLWGGPKAAIVVHHKFAKQKREDVLEAINRVSPYPVRQTTMWAAAKH